MSSWSVPIVFVVERLAASHSGGYCPCGKRKRTGRKVVADVRGIDPDGIKTVDVTIGTDRMCYDQAGPR